MKVLTTQGLVDIHKLHVHDVVSWSGNTRTTATEWYLEEELVRRDVWINALRGIETEAMAKATRNGGV